MRFNWEGVGGDQETVVDAMWERSDDYPRENSGPITDAVCLVDGCSSQGSHSEKIQDHLSHSHGEEVFEEMGIHAAKAN